MALAPLAKPPLPARLRGFLWVVPWTLFLGLTILVVNGIQTLSVLLLPVSRTAFRRLNRFLANTWWGWCVTASRLAHGFELEITGDELPMRESALVVVNHQSMADVPMLMDLARRKDRLGDLKFFVKDELKWVPGMGLGMWFLDCIFVKRDWTRDRASVQATFARVVDGKVPIWLVSFSEGTRLTPKKLAASNAFAASRGLAATEHVMHPRPTGFAASVQGLRGHVDAVYDVTIGYVGGVPSLWQYALGYAPRAHLHVCRFGIGGLPDSDGELATWLRDRFMVKDRRLAGFYASGAM